MRQVQSTSYVIPWMTMIYDAFAGSSSVSLSDCEMSFVRGIIIITIPLPLDIDGEQQ